MYWKRYGTKALRKYLRHDCYRGNGGSTPLTMIYIVLLSIILDSTWCREAAGSLIRKASADVVTALNTAGEWAQRVSDLSRLFCGSPKQGCFHRLSSGHSEHVRSAALSGMKLSEGTAHEPRNFISDFLQDRPTPETGPYFDTTVESNTTGLVGKTVHLVCRVKNLGNLTVSWVRHRDIHLLTVGRYTYTSDQRFEAMHAPLTEEWTLRIRYPQRKDTGYYECQISTTPPIGHLVYLTIVEPITEILGGSDLFINKGSTINITCLVKHAPEPPNVMTWSHNQLAINFDSPRGGISLVTEKGRITTSRLLIQKAIQSDSGLYTCTPGNASPSSVRVHILNEEHPAAMHHGSGERIAATVLPVVLLLRMVF